MGVLKMTETVEVVENVKREFKLVLIGDNGVGKSTFIRRHIEGEKMKKYIPTIGAEVLPLNFQTNFGEITFNCWDIAGGEKIGGLRDGFFAQSDCGIIMFDVTSRQSYKNLPGWHEDITRICGAIPLVILANKVDNTDRKNYNYVKPFIYLCRKVLGKDDLIFTESPPLVPPESKVDLQLQERYAQELCDSCQVGGVVCDDDDW